MIPIVVLAVVILAQVIAFQFLALRLTRAMPDALLSAAEPRSAVAERVGRFRESGGKMRRVLGLVFLLAVVCLGFIVPLDTGHRKLGLAAVSILSSIALVVGLLADRKRFLRIAADLPGSELRAASLRRRRFWDSYAPAWEAAPPAIFLLTVVGTILFAGGGAVPRGELLADLRIWWLPLFQLIILGTLFAMALGRVRASGCLPGTARALGSRPERMVEMQEILRRHEARYDLAIRIGIALQFAALQAKGLARWTMETIPLWLSSLPWIVLLGLLAVFAAYLLTLRRVVRAGLLCLAALLALGSSAAASSLLPPSGVADEGTFRFYMNEEVLVTTAFRWGADGTYEGEYTLATAGQRVTSRLEIRTEPSGRWASMRLEGPAGVVTVAHEDTIARITRGTDVRTVSLAKNPVLFENFSPAMMSEIVAAYDEETGGTQTLPIFVIPAIVLEATIVRLDPIERTIQGRDHRLRRYQMNLHGVGIAIHVDEQGKVVFGDVPSQHGAYVREGYEALLKKEDVDPLLSKPEHEIAIQSGIGVPMRDGKRLATDIYKPIGEGPFPVILVRTPYKKEMNELQARFYARRGYVYAVQDCRGRFSSPGKWEPFMNESADGYDTIEWLAAQPWSSGKVGMIGASYLGWVQWWAARDRPPHLTTIIPNVAPPDPFYNIPYEYGVFFLLGAIWWADILETEATGDLSGKAMREIGKKKYARLLRDLPVVDLDKKVLGKKNKYWREWIDHPTNDAYWDRASFLDRLGPLNIPVFHQSGWFDGDGIGSKLNYLAMASHGHPHQKLVIGPWGHTDTATRRLGDRDFGSEAIVDLQRDYLRWMDRWLKGIENGIEKEPLVSLFVMGVDRWIHGESYPIEGTEMRKLYLASGGSANTSHGDGRLTWDPPDAATPPDRYAYDPADPTPSPQIYVDPSELEEEEKEGQVVSTEEARARRRAYHATVTAERPDILVYEMEVTGEPVTIVGPVSAVLYASTSAADTDWFVRLAEVDSTGSIFHLAEGKIRARFHRSMREPELLEPGRIYEYRIDLWQTAIEIPAGSRLRVEVASASFPLFSRNLNTGGHNEKEKKFVKAEQTIHHDAERPSHLLLPVVPGTKE